MSRPIPPQPPFRRALVVALGLLLTGMTLPALAWQAVPGRQVTLFGIHAVPGGNAVDPKLKKIEPQLKKLFPGHSFKLVKTESKRLTVGRSVTCTMDTTGFIAGAELINVLDGDGNVQFKFALELNGQTEFATLVRTPPNQLFFCDKMLPDGSRLLIGLGGR
ncbi:MAG: hypothetical protein JWN86_1832 [Planctomycetota bacterium]|nr:hypothetical protein [Planctomycetota bacterium]